MEKSAIAVRAFRAAMLCVGLLLPPVAAWAVGGWGQQGRDAAGTWSNAEETTLTPSNLMQLEVKWSKAVDSPSSMLAADGQVYVSGRSPSGRQPLLLRLSAATGEQQWKIRLPSDDFFNFALTDDLIIGVSELSVVAFRRANGERVWDYSPQGTDPRDRFLSVQIDNGLVVAASDLGEVVALDAATGVERWRKQPRAGAYRSVRHVSIADGRVFLVGFPFDGLVVLDAVTGQRLWTYSTVTFLSIETRATVVGSKVFVADGGGQVHAVDVETGQLIWLAQAKCASSLIGKVCLPDQLASEAGRIFVLVGGDRISALDAQSGQFLWDARAGNLTAGLAVANDVLYFLGAGNRNGFRNRVFALDVATGAELPIARIPTLSNFPDLIVSEGQLLLTDGDQVQAVGLAP